ncbi:MAG: L,D-transpeptidase [Terrimicrobiaceae bacterium]|nr:L,D-transpeptidase [Terrimicrobiaceae bacterium]
MKPLRIALLAAAALAALTGCETLQVSAPYNPPAHRPKNPGAVRVKVSLKNQMVYVLEGDRPLLVAATCVGLPGKSTPTGNMHVIEKIATKRSGSYGFSISGNNIRPCEAGSASGRYVGYPMAWWVGFSPGYGFHQGYVWPIPRTHGCLRLHKSVAWKFYALVHEGTPVNIAYTQPEDATIGRNQPRPTDYKDPDPPAALMVSPAAFQPPKGSPFVD